MVGDAPHSLEMSSPPLGIPTEAPRSPPAFNYEPILKIKAIENVLPVSQATEPVSRSAPPSPSKPSPLSSVVQNNGTFQAIHLMDYSFLFKASCISTKRSKSTMHS